jgi:hypothetical protein
MTVAGKINWRPLSRGRPVSRTWQTLGYETVLKDVRPSAVIRITRPWRFVHAAISYRVLVDDIEYGNLQSGKSVEVALEPGDYLVEVIGGHARPGSSQVTVLPGEVCNVECLTRLSLFTLATSGWSLGMGKAPAWIMLQVVS